MTTDKTRHMIDRMSETADDFFHSILILKTQDKQNNSIPFLHGHVLELSAKTACCKLDIDFSSAKHGHDVIKIYNLLKIKIPEIEPFIRTTLSLTKYKDIWLPGNSSNSNVQLTEQNELQRLELAYIIDNVMNLKYGFNKNYEQVSRIQIYYDSINEYFCSLFKLCRQTYQTDKLNNRLKQKMYTFFGKTESTNIRLKDLLDI